MGERLAKAAVIVFATVVSGSAASADAYVNQLDQGRGGQGVPQMSTGAGPAYVPQLPADARPVVVRPAKGRQADASRSRVLAVRKQPAYPNVGAGVSLALTGAKTDTQLPNVGRGVVKR